MTIKTRKESPCKEADMTEPSRCRRLKRYGGCKGSGSVVADGVVSTGASTLAAL